VFEAVIIGVSIVFGKPKIKSEPLNFKSKFKMRNRVRGNQQLKAVKMFEDMVNYNLVELSSDHFFSQGLIFLF